MSLIVVAEILSGETLVSPSGPVDAVTTTSADEDLWTSPNADLLASLRPSVEYEPEGVGVG